MATKPTDDEIEAVRAHLKALATKDADKATTAMIDLVTMPEFATIEEAMRKAFMLNLSNTELGHSVAMFERMRAAHTPR